MIFECTTGWNDYRVLYWEPTKAAAKLRALKTDSNTVILHVLDAGHEGSSGLSYYEELSHHYAFVLKKILPVLQGEPKHHWWKLALGLSLVAVAVFLGTVVAVFAIRKLKKRKYEQIKDHPLE